MDLTLEDLAWDTVDHHLGFIADRQSLHAVLPEPADIRGIVLVDEGHHRAIHVGGRYHAGAQRQLDDVTIARGVDHGLLQRVLGLVELCLQIIDGRFLLIQLGDDVVHVGLGDVEVTLLADAAAYQFQGTIAIQAG
ncbi:hypothetical protein D3C80_843180 [compost metagenome]